MNKGQMMGESAELTLLQMNEKLKEENEMLEGYCNEWSGSNHIYEQQQQKLEEEIKKLKKENEKLEEELQYAKKIIDSKETSWNTNKRLLEENKKLKEQYEKLEEKCEKRRVRNCDRNQELVKALSPWKKDHEDHKRILEAIFELKEENKKLKEDFTKYTGQNVSPDILKKYDELRDEYDDLKADLAGMTADRDEKEKENEMLKETLKENNNMNDFKVGDMVYISPKSIGDIDSSANDFHPESVKILKITPKRFKIEWDADGNRDEPVIIYVKNVYKNQESVIY
jgi:DNA repair exonuclease SbcCD ATPase subunit